MKTKSSAKSSSSKQGSKSAKPAKRPQGKGSPAPAGSKLASLKGAVKTFFGSTGKKGAAPAKVAAPKAEKIPAKLPAGKAVKGKAATALVAPAPVQVAKGKGKAAAASAAPATRAAAKPAARSTPRSAIDAESVCREVACEGLSTTGGYCRLHYVKNWKKIKRKELILKEGKLNQYIEELVAKYPDKYIEAIRQDLADDKAFAKVIYDLDLDESVDEFDVDGENLDAVIDGIKRDFDDEGETF